MAEGIGTGAFTPTYRDCVDGNLTEGVWGALIDGAVSRQFRDLMGEREREFDSALTDARQNPGDRSSLLAYQLMLGVTADEVRQLGTAQP